MKLWQHQMLSAWTFWGEWKNRLSTYLSLVGRKNQFYSIDFRLLVIRKGNSKLVFLRQQKCLLLVGEANLQSSMQGPSSLINRCRFVQVVRRTMTHGLSMTEWLAVQSFTNPTQSSDWSVGRYAAPWMNGCEVQILTSSTRHFDWMVWGYKFYAAPEQISHVGYKVYSSTQHLPDLPRGAAPWRGSRQTPAWSAQLGSPAPY